MTDDVVVNKIVNFLNNHCNKDDVIDGADFIGNGWGDFDTDWKITDQEALVYYMEKCEKSRNSFGKLLLQVICNRSV